MRRLGALLLTGALVLAACGGDAVFTTGFAEPDTSSSEETPGDVTTPPMRETTTTPRRETSTTTTTEAVTTSIAVHPLLPDALDRDLIPWDEVAAGWALVLFSTASGYGDVESPYPELVVAYLVAPDGKPYEIAVWPAAEAPEAIHDVRPDGRLAVLGLQGRPALLDVATGSMGPAPAGITGPYATFTRPEGGDYVMLTDASTVELRSADASNVVDLGPTYDQHLDYGRPLRFWVYGPDGLTVVVNRPDGPVLLDTRGQVLRYLDEVGLPCTALRWFGADTVVLRCEVVRSRQPTVQQLWLIDPSGERPPIPFTPEDVSGFQPAFDGFVDTLRAGEETFLQGELGVGGGWFPIYQPTPSGSLEPFGGSVAGQLVTGDRGSVTVLLLGASGEVYGRLSHYDHSGRLIAVLDAPEGILGAFDAHGVGAP